MKKNLILAQDPYNLFLFALKAPETRRKYIGHLDKFFEFIDGKLDDNLQVRHKRTKQDLEDIRDKCKSFIDRAKNDNTWALSIIIQFLQFLRDRVENKEITAGTLKNYNKAVRLFCEMSEVDIPWKRITRGLPRPKRYASDRVPSFAEIIKLSEYPDRRIKAIVYIFLTSGIRLGAWDYLQFFHFEPMEEDGKIVAVKMKVYAGEPEEYFTFITPEAWHELEKWKNYREECGEAITGDSWIMRNLWDVTTLPHRSERNDSGMGSGTGKGIVSMPKKLQSQGVKRLLMRALYAQGLRSPLPKDKKRHEFQGIHSLRKVFQTQCEIAGLRNVNIQTLMGRSMGVNDSYYRITVTDLLNDYRKVIPLVTLDSKYNLERRMAEMQEKNKDRDKEKDQQIDFLTKKQEQLERLVQSFIDSGQLTAKNQSSQIEITE